MSEEQLRRLKAERGERVAQGQETPMDRAIAEVERYSEAQERWTGDGFEPIFEERNWGIWSPTQSWWFLSGGDLWLTTSKAIALAQLDIVLIHRPHEGYVVRCIEEWYEEVADED